MEDIDNIKDFYEYMSIIKETVINFDVIYNKKTNTSEIKSLQNMISTSKKKSRRNI